jgi:glutathione peroxidase
MSRAALEALQRKHAARGFSVLGFPCNQFGGQEPGTEAQILEFCTLNYEVSFPMYGKVEVNGEGTHPLYAHLKSEAPGLLGSESLKWNFTKFLVDREGRVVRRYAPTDSPESIEKDIEVLL